MRILGLDVSTTTIGISVIDFDDEKASVIYIGYYKPEKGLLPDHNFDFLNMLRLAKREIISIISEYKPDHVAVEDFIKFMSGGSGAATIIPLAVLNRTLCLSITETFSQLPLHICNVISIRTRIKKASKLTSLPKKDEIPALLETILNIEIPRPTKDVRGKSPRLMEEHYDMADAIAVAYYCNQIITESK
jgi:Holliday junction resolvasome RuvABC endonuclease subunit